MFDYAAHGLLGPTTQRRLPGDGPQTIGALLERPLRDHPERLALVGRRARFTYRALEQQVARASQRLRAADIGQGDRLAVCLPNDVDIVIALLACAKLGAIWVGVNRPLAPPEKAYILHDSGAKVYLTDSQGRDEIAAQSVSLPALQQVLCLVSATQPEPWPEAEIAVGTAAVPVDAFSPAAIAYTSGTTGRPKGAVHSHHNLLLPGAIAVTEGRFGADCPQGVMLPLTILNLMVLAPLVAFQDGSCCVCMDSLKPQDIARWVRDEGVGHFASVPTVMQDLLTSELVQPGDLASLGHPDIGGASIAQQCQRLYRERFGRRMTIAYGMTEAPTIVARTEADCDPVDELCGKAVAQVEIIIIDDDGQPVAVGEIGQVCIKPAAHGPYAGIYTPMLGYWNKPAETRKALRNGMYHTGDLGYMDAQGQLFIRGRQNDLIIRGGANVYPAEVERVLDGHAAVAATAVVGVPDERLGQRVVAVVQLADADTAPSVDLQRALLALCQAQLARYKVPEQMHFVAALPRNAMSKIVKAKLAAALPHAQNSDDNP